MLVSLKQAGEELSPLTAAEDYISSMTISKLV